MYNVYVLFYNLTMQRIYTNVQCTYTCTLYIGVYVYVISNKFKILFFSLLVYISMACFEYERQN